MYPIILASTSPRRQDILKSMNIPFVVHPAGIDETCPADMDLHNLPLYLAQQKVQAVLDSMQPDQEVRWILGADTVVIFDKKLYGKPSSQEEAAEFLRTFQGNTQEVITGMALYNGSKKETTTKLCKCKVTFATMSEEEIQWYIDTGEWHGVAGGYRIQGLGSCFIKNIQGSETGVMGLPIFDLYDMLKKQGYSIIE